MKIVCQQNWKLTAASIYVALLSCSAFCQSNTIPWSDSFEQYSNNSSIINSNYWMAPTSTCATVTNGLYTYTNAFRPLRFENHTNYVVLNTENYAVSNLLGNPSGVSYTNVWIDTMVKFQPWSADTPSALITNDAAVQAAFFIDTNSHLMIYHSKRLGATSFTNLFTTNMLTTYDTNLWHRLTVKMDFFGSGSPVSCFKVQVDGGPPITNALAFTNTFSPYYPGGSWFICANYQASNPKKVSSVSFSGTGFIDDFSVTNDQPRYGWLITSTNPTPMGLSFQPNGQWEVPDGSIVTFTNTTVSNYWTWSGISSDGVLSATGGWVPNFSFSPVNADHTYTVVLTPSGYTTNHVPTWWLATYVTGGVLPTNNDATNDTDHDGVPNWQEWLASTDPNDANSKFQITAHYQLNGTTYVKWVSPCIDPLLPPFEVKRSTNLTQNGDGHFVIVDGSVTRAKTNIWAELNPPTNVPAFYRIVATNSF